MSQRIDELRRKDPGKENSCDSWTEKRETEQLIQKNASLYVCNLDIIVVFPTPEGPSNMKGVKNTES